MDGTITMVTMVTMVTHDLYRAVHAYLQPGEDVLRGLLGNECHTAWMQTPYSFGTFGDDSQLRSSRRLNSFDLQWLKGL
jgi:CubicO group peptidase (beta-lactamase class C family)